MTDNNNQQADSQAAEIESSRIISKFWLIPLVALSIGMWMVYHQWANQGPLITIEFVSASGIEADQTKIKTKDVEIGVVKKVELKPDLSGVIVTARMNPSAEVLLGENSKFWLVRPRVSLNGVSGLTTLLSGPYITLEPNTEGEQSNEFVALETPPTTAAGTPGLQISLTSNQELSFKAGDPIIYKGLKVGEFEDMHFDVDKRVVSYNAFIQAPYHKLVTENTKFWNASGISLDLAANGIEVKTGSIETILTNGVTFGIPDGMPTGDLVTTQASFEIYKDYESASNKRYKLGVNFVLMIKDSIRGLTVGAPVEYRGLQIGKVVKINLPGLAQSKLLDEEFAIPVLITIQPSRMQQPDDQTGVDIVQKQTLRGIEQGLRASLKIGNIVTGGLYVDLQHYTDAEPEPLSSFLGYNVIPTTSGEFAQITQKVSGVLDNINAIPFAEISQDASQLMRTFSSTAQAFQQTIDTLDGLLVDVKDQQTSENINHAAESLTQLLKDYSAGSKTNQELISTMQRFQTTLEQLTPLLQQLNQKPNSLIFSDGSSPIIEPKAQSLNEEIQHD
ncbi:intermembrane transport protein PqiB [Aliiglaciecola sp. 3_MG-2023]|uniref:intermembrane transport protein PqiB n=1 Tax=Aliiglaciecola sp. 3_MG-2023 TaxID=3062644 RepID=UPI0026E1ABE3|nr:intermembrane transport protein PqiB [Aliiglaciecola sp. 3_MG-2023]MDO6694457.1 intermembrane transport protein PqiB [Aliiglaciecola sp. 3_MG-2023]